MEMPFTKRVVEYPLLNKFKSPQIPSYSGISDPTEHLENYQMHLALHATLDEVACRAFPTTLSGNAREWFQSLIPRSMDAIKDLALAFLTHFLGSQERKKPSGYLLILHQKEGESLKEFMIQLNTK
jgi:hypothetical protein